MTPDDRTLTESGLAPAASGGRMLVLACGALAHEIMALIRLNGWQHVELACLPAIYHNTPEKIVPAMEAALVEAKPRFERIFVAYADCGTGGELAKLCARHGVEMIDGPHCYAFYSGLQSFAALPEDEITSFYLTDFLARQFEAFVIRPLGLDRYPQLRDDLFGHYEKLVYLAQTDDPKLDARAREAAERLGLAYERRFTGYGELETALANQIT